MVMSLDDIREHVASLFIMLNKKTVILFRIEFLVVLVTLVFFAMFLMDCYRRTIHNSFMRAVFSVFDAVSDSIVVYLLGAMQTAPFKNQLFPVWALVLVNFRYSADYISGYGVPDRRGRRYTEWRNVFKLLGSAFLNGTRGSSFSGPLWMVWGLQILRSGYRFFSHTLASGSFWHGRSSELVAEHMRAMHQRGGDDQVMMSSREEVFNAVTMEGYKYLVYGETKQKKKGFRLKKPQYALTTNQDQPPLITLDKIWEYSSPHIQQQQLQGKKKQVVVVKKDLPLAFALSRLLRCRFEDVTLQRCIFDTNRELMKSIVAGKVGTSDALKIMELQLAFVHDYFNTRYPMIFCCGLPSLFFSLLLSVLTMVAVVWLGVEIRKVFKPPSGSGELANLVKGFNVDTIITWLFIVLMIAKEVWEMYTYLRSDWTSMIKECEHVQRKFETSKEFIDLWMYCILLHVSPRSSQRITDTRWHGFIDQYVFVESYDNRPWFWNLFHNLTTGIVPKEEEGAKLGSAVPVPEYVKEAVMKKLSELTEDNNGGGRAGAASRGLLLLPGFITTLSNNSDLSRELQRYQSYTATTGSGGGGVVLPTASHIILVWHIATSLCEMELAKKHGVELRSPWFSSLCSSKPYLLGVDDKEGCCSSWFKFTNCCCCSSEAANDKTEEKKEQQEVNVNGKLPAGALREAYIIANSLSRYCAYLLVSKPDLIPDSFLVPKIVFQKAVSSARDGILQGTCSLDERYTALLEVKDKDEAEEDVLKQGVALGKELLNHTSEEDRWKVLAGVWTELLIHTAPTWNAQAHRKCLSAGEFITHVWALLWHYGIQKSSLWPTDTGPQNSEPQQQVGPEDGGDDQAAAGMMETRRNNVRERGHIGITIDEADVNKEKGTKELEASDSGSTSTGTEPLRKEGNGSSEIEEVSGDAITNVPRGNGWESPK